MSDKTSALFATKQYQSIKQRNSIQTKITIHGNKQENVIHNMGKITAHRNKSRNVEAAEFDTQGLLKN